MLYQIKRYKCAVKQILLHVTKLSLRNRRLTTHQKNK